MDEQVQALLNRARTRRAPHSWQATPHRGAGEIPRTAALRELRAEPVFEPCHRTPPPSHAGSIQTLDEPVFSRKPKHRPLRFLDLPTLNDAVPDQRDQECCPQLQVESTLHTLPNLRARTPTLAKRRSLATVTLRPLRVDLNDGDSYAELFSENCRLRLYKEEIKVPELQGLDWFDIALPECYQPTLSKEEAVSALWPRALEPWAGGDFFGEAQARLSNIDPPENTRRGLFFENGYYRQVVSWAAKIVEAHIDVLELAPDRAKSWRACDISKMKSRIGTVRIDLDPRNDSREGDGALCGPYEMWLNQDANGYVSPEVGFYDASNRGFAIWPSDRIVLCEINRMYACIIDHYLWWAWRLYSYGIEHNDRTKLAQALMCARVAIGELSQLGYMLVHELGHLVDKSYGHCTSLVQWPSYCCTYYNGYLMRAYLEGLEAGQPHRTRQAKLEPDADIMRGHVGVAFAWEIRDQLGWEREWEGNGNCATDSVTDPTIGLVMRVFRADMMTPETPITLTTTVAGRCFSRKRGRDDTSVSLFA